MYRPFTLLVAVVLIIDSSLATGAAAQRQQEPLDRGVVAIRQDDGGVFVSWRLLAGDAKETVFHVYRAADEGEPSKLTDMPLVGPTHWIDRSADPDKATRSWPGS